MQRYTPSGTNFNYWAGIPSTDSRGYTREQVRTLGERELQTLTVKMMTQPRRFGEVGRCIEIPCPLIRSTTTGHLVITPSGRDKWVDRSRMNP